MRAYMYLSEGDVLSGREMMNLVCGFGLYEISLDLFLNIYIYG